MKIHLSELKPLQRGRYMTVVCPQCGHHEAYIYTDDFQKSIEEGKEIPIRCNRLTNCGKTTFVQIVKENGESIPNPKEKEELKMTQEGAKRIQALAEFLTAEYKECALHERVLDINDAMEEWRGISKRTLQSSGILFLDMDKGFRGFIEKYPTLYSDFYKRSLYERDILIPIWNEHGKVERILLRSRGKIKAPEGKKPLKEIAIILSPKAEEVWNIEDMKNTSVLFVTEGVPDALSIKEVNPNAHVVAIPGVGKYKKVIKHLKKHQNIKKIVIAFDNDGAGEKWTKKFEKSLDEIKIKHSYLELKSYKDVNEYLLGEKKSLEQEVNFHLGRRFRHRSTTENKISCNRSSKIHHQNTNIKEKKGRYFYGKQPICC